MSIGGGSNRPDITNGSKQCADRNGMAETGSVGTYWVRPKGLVEVWILSPLILYIKMKWLFFVFVCLFVPYTNPHFWTDLNRPWHTSPPSSGEGRRVCMDPQYSAFPTFSVSFLASWCRILHRRWLPVPGSSPKPWFQNACVWRHGCDVCRITTQACQPTQSRACLCR